MSHSGVDRQTACQGWIRASTLRVSKSIVGVSGGWSRRASSCDERFAQSFCAARGYSKGHGPIKIRAELLKRGRGGRFDRAALLRLPMLIAAEADWFALASDIQSTQIWSGRATNEYREKARQMSVFYSSAVFRAGADPAQPFAHGRSAGRSL